MSIDQTVAAVIGAGFIGREHARAYAEHPLVDLDVIVDVDEETADEVAEEFDANRVAYSVSDALDKKKVDVATVATPESHHVDPAQELLRHDCDVLLEKPMAETVEDARRIGKVADQSAGELMIGYLLRFEPHYSSIKEQIDNDNIGDVLSIRAERIASLEMYERVSGWTNPMYYLAIHDIDIMRWYTGSEVSGVFSKAIQRPDDTDVPAIIHTTLEFKDGTIGSLETNWARSKSHPSYRSDKVVVTGSEGYIQKEDSDELQVAANESFVYKQPSELHGKSIGALPNEVDHFVSCSRTGEPPLVSWQDGLRTLEITNAVIQSMEADEYVKLNNC